MAICSPATVRDNCGLLGPYWASARFTGVLGRHYAPWQRNRWRRTVNRLTSAQVTRRRCMFFFCIS